MESLMTALSVLVYIVIGVVSLSVIIPTIYIAIMWRSVSKRKKKRRSSGRYPWGGDL